VLATGRATAADLPAANSPPQPLPLMPVVKPGKAGQMLYYQKDASGIQQAAFQDARGAAPPEGTLLPPSATNVTPPKINEIGVNNEESLRASISAEVRKYKESPIFRHFPGDDPKAYEPLTKAPYSPRAYQPGVEQVEPMYVCYDRLYFENKNSDRYGWDLGFIQPFVSAAKFYTDFVFLPYNYGTRPCQRYEADAGYCLPGDPVPYLIYPVELSVTGGLLEAGTVVGLAAMFN
jgi:hypothetical protein